MARKIPGRALDSNTSVSVANISFGSNVTVNTSTILLGNSTVNTVINSTSVATKSLVANGTIGTDGQLLASNGTALYWTNPPASTNTNAQYTWTNNHTFQAAFTIANTLTVGNSTVNTVINSTSISGNGSNITSVDAATLGGNTASTLRTYTDTVSATAYSNAVAYAASNTYVNNTFLPLAGGTLTGNLTINATANVVSNLAANNVVIRGDIQIDGNLTVSGTSVTLNTASLAVEDNMIYLNNGSQVTHPDLGFAGNYNDGSYKHAGFFRDATDATWKVFDGYTPEPDASAYIDTGNATFRIANFTANVITANSFSGNGASVTSVDAATVGGNTASTLRSYTDTVAATAFSNAAARADSAYSNAIAYSANATNLSSGTVAFARLPAVYLGTTQIQSSSAAQAVSGITTLAAGNTTITGFANVTTTLQVGTNTATFGTTAYVVANGNIGIGTNSPANKLQISGTLYQSDAYASIGGYNSGSQNTPFNRYGATFGTNITNGQAETDIWNPTDPATYTSTGILFTQALTSTTRRDLMFLKHDGNVGIGTNSPTDFGGRNLNINSPNNSTYASTLWVSGAYIMQALVNEASAVMSIGARSNHKLDLCTNDTTRMTISNTGNIGIGNSSPTAKLEVYGGAIAAGLSQLSIGNALSTTATLSPSNWYRLATLTASNQGATVEIHVRIGGTHNNTIIKVSKGTGNWRAEIYRAGHFVDPGSNSAYIGIDKVRVYDVSVNGETHIDIKIAGDTTSVLYNVVVMNEVTLSNTRTTLVALTNQGSGAAGVEFQAIGVLASWGHSASGQAVTFRESGNVGIGTSSPSYKLDVTASTSTGTAGIRVSAQFGGGIFGAYTNYPAMMYDSSGLKPVIVYDTNNNLNLLYTSNTERMRIDGSGNFTFGSQMKIVTGTGAIAGGTAGNSVGFNHAGIFIDRTWSDYPGISVMNQNAAGNGQQGQFRFHGTNASFNSYPSTSGSDFSVQVWSDGGFYDASDRRFKTNITTIANALSTVMSLTGRRFQTINSDGVPETNVTESGYRIGFVAQEVQEAGLHDIYRYHPEDDDGTDGYNKAYAIHYGSVTALLVEAIKELKQELDSAKARINQLENP